MRVWYSGVSSDRKVGTWFHSANEYQFSVTAEGHS